MANTTKSTTKKRATSTAKMSSASMSAKSSSARSTARRNNNTSKRKNSDSEKPGFTIIEVVLVLAIAGLIFLMVFIALPQLQRAQRDTQRRNDLARITEAITSYQTNNNGKLPGDSKVGSVEADGDVPWTKVADCSDTTKAKAGGACGLLRNYLHSVNATNNEFIDPDGNTYGINISTFTDGTNYASNFDHIIYVVKKAKCNGELVEAASNPREYAVTYKLEGNGTYCQDNGV